jgi:hypothetical protein
MLAAIPTPGEEVVILAAAARPGEEAVIPMATPTASEARASKVALEVAALVECLYSLLPLTFYFY